MKVLQGRIWVQTAILALLLFAYGLATRLTAGINKADESWFLQVVSRVLSGDTLYRNIFFGATPLSVYIAALPVFLFGTELLVIKILFALCFTGTVLVGRHVAFQLGLNRTYFTLAMLLYLAPIQDSLYSELATLGLMVSFSLALQLGSPQILNKRWTFFAALGGLAGLTFADKQNIGVYIAVAFGLSLVAVLGLRQPAKLFKVGVIVTVAFIVTVGVLLLPILLSNSVSQFWDYGFANKSTYLETAGISYFGQVNTLLNSLQNPTPTSIWQFQVNFLYVLALVTLAILFLLLLFRKRTITTFIVLLFACVACISEYPRFDYAHFHNTAPTIIIATAYTWQQLIQGRWQPLRRAAQVAGLYWLVIGISLFVCLQTNAVLSGTLVEADLPHFRGVLIRSVDAVSINQQRIYLLKFALDGPLLLVSPEASFYYLVTGIKNPTPFDYPLVTAFGQHGEAQVIDALANGSIRTVCFRPVSGALRPTALETFITEKMTPGQNIGICTEYTLTPQP